MDDDGTTRRLNIKIDGYDLLRLIDEIEYIDALANIDVKKLALTADPLPEQIDFPSPAERAHASKIVRMLMLGMRSLWRPVIRAIADHATMTSLGQGKGKDVAAAVGRQRVIEGLRIAESIRKGIARSEQHNAVNEAKHWPARRARILYEASHEPTRQAQQRYVAFFDSLVSEVLAGLAETPVPANDNHRVEAATSIAA
jgi:hypothetical protein